MRSKFILILFLALSGPFLLAQLPGRFQAPGFDFEPGRSLEYNTIAMDFPIGAPKHFITFALRCSGASTAGTFEVRLAAADYDKTGRLGDWIKLQDDKHVDLPPGQRQFEMLFFPADTRFMELRASGLAAKVSTEYIFYSPIDFDIVDPVSEAAPPAYSTCPCPMPNFVDRAGWGAPPAQQPGCTPAYTSVSHLFVHHQAGVANPPYAAVVASIRQHHIFTNNWCDIGYHWLIAPDGTVFEGRFGGNNVKGAHATGLNDNSMAVCMLGNFQNDQPTPAALESLDALLAWKCCDSDIDPSGSSVHAGSGLSFNHISGHRDGAATLCPGDNMYSQLPNVRVTTDTLYRDPTGCDGLWPPGNDDCDNAVLLFSAESCMPIEGTTNDATASGVPIPTCSGFTSETALDVWYTFGATEDHHQVTVKPTGNLPDPLDAVIAVYEGNCNNLQLVACVDVPGGAGLQTTLDLPDLVPGHVYYIRVYDFGSEQASDGRFEICVTHGAAVGINEAFTLEGASIFPNPASVWVTVELPNYLSEKVTIDLYNWAGNRVLTEAIDRQKAQLDISALAAGSYLAVISTSVGQSRHIVVKL